MGIISFEDANDNRDKEILKHKYIEVKGYFQGRGLDDVDIYSSACEELALRGFRINEMWLPLEGIEYLKYNDATLWNGNYSCDLLPEPFLIDEKQDANFESYPVIFGGLQIRSRRVLNPKLELYCAFKSCGEVRFFYDTSYEAY